MIENDIHERTKVLPPVTYTEGIPEWMMLRIHSVYVQGVEHSIGDVIQQLICINTQVETTAGLVTDLIGWLVDCCVNFFSQRQQQPPSQTEKGAVFSPALPHVL